MQGIVKFKREKNRTPEDIFRQMIQPKLPLALNVICQKIIFYGRQNHSYRNRTGALENSLTWIPAKIENLKITAAVIAGGLTKAQFNYAETTVFYKDEQGRLRVFEQDKGVALASWYAVRKGDPIYVNYAQYVEAKGLPVLKHAVERYRHDVAELLAREMKADHIPRVSEFKNEDPGMRN